MTQLPTVFGDSPYAKRIDPVKLADWMKKQGMSERRIAHFRLQVRSKKLHPIFPFPSRATGVYNQFHDSITISTEGQTKENIHWLLMHEFQHMLDAGNIKIQVLRLSLLAVWFLLVYYLPTHVFFFFFPQVDGLYGWLWTLLVLWATSTIYYKYDILEKRANKTAQSWNGEPDFFYE